MVLLKGIVIGFLFAAPVGPIGLMCIRRSLADGPYAAFVASLGAAVADTFYGAVAAFGLTLISDFLMDYTTPLSFIGSAILLVLGVKTFRTTPAYLPRPNVHIGLLRDLFSTLMITLTNPATIIAFMAVFASMGSLRFEEINWDSGALVLGVFIGSAAWWFILSLGAGALRNRFNQKWLRRLNQTSGILLVGFGVAVVAMQFWPL